jgi:lysophospholipid acyltransferase (LPLAT)-like uncharacterized protein
MQVATIAGLGYPLINALGHTLRWRVEGLQHSRRFLASGRQPVMAFWHGRILPCDVLLPPPRHRGDHQREFRWRWIARIIERFGYGTARGSTSRGGKKAMLQLVRDMKTGRAAGFTLDGPRGPARVAQAGAVWLASATGNPVLPFHLEASSHWSLRSWDRTQIPKPFSTIGLVVGEPFEVPTEAAAETLEQAREDLERRLSLLETRAIEIARTS